MIKLFVSLLLAFLLVTPLKAEDELLAFTPSYMIGTKVFHGKQMIVFQGEMSEYSMLMLTRIMKEREIDDLAINSIGGVLDEAFVLGKYIDEYDVSVYIPEKSICVSACAFAVMRSDNIVNDGYGLLFHSPYLAFLDTTVTIQEVMKQQSIVTLEMMQWFMDSGYSVDLLNIIYRHSDRTKFIVFTDPKFLYEFKVKEFSTKVEIKPEWFKIEER